MRRERRDDPEFQQRCFRCGAEFGVERIVDEARQERELVGRRFEFIVEHVFCLGSRGCDVRLGGLGSPWHVDAMPLGGICVEDAINGGMIVKLPIEIICDLLRMTYREHPVIAYHVT